MVIRIFCQYCSHYSCTTFEKHGYNKQYGFFCDGFNLWTHRWCARVSKLKYKCLTEKSVEPCYCKKYKKSKACSLFYLTLSLPVPAGGEGRGWRGLLILTYLQTEISRKR